jgi:hypothetical protein
LRHRLERLSLLVGADHDPEAVDRIAEQQDLDAARAKSFDDDYRLTKWPTKGRIARASAGLK